MTSKRRNRTMLHLEELENRLAPAYLLSALRVDFRDQDNDHFAIIASRPIFVDLATTNAILSFGNGVTVDTSGDFTIDAPAALQSVDLTVADPGLTPNIDFTVKLITRGVDAAGVRTGNGALGGEPDGTDDGPGVAVNATGIALRNLTLRGDLASLQAGDGSVSVRNLDVNSIGAYNVSVEDSELLGDVGTLKVVRNITEAKIHVQGDVNKIQVGGSLVGPKVIAGLLANDNESGFITVDGDINYLTVSGSFIGGGTNSARVETVNGSIVNVFVGGSLMGGGANGVPADGSAVISSDGPLGTVRVVGSLIGSADSNASVANDSALIESRNDAVGNVTISGSISGGVSDDSGVLRSPISIGNIRVGGSVFGGSANGGSGENSGRIHSDGDIGSVTIFGSVVGNSGSINNLGSVNRHNGEISSGGNMGAVRINGHINGGEAQFSGLVSVGGNLTSISVGKSLSAGDGDNSGIIQSVGNMGPVRIGTHIDGTKGFGGNGVAAAGAIIAGDLTDASSTSTITSITVGGSVKGNTNTSPQQQTTGPNGAILAAGTIGSIKISGNLEGGQGSGVSDPVGYIQGGKLTSVFIGGSIKSSTAGSGLENSGAIRAVNDIGSLTVKGSIIGNASNSVGISAFGTQTRDGDASDIAMSVISVGGSVSFCDILAGYQVDATSGYTIDLDNGANPDAQITTVSIGGDLTASNIVAGAIHGADKQFGSLDGGATTDDLLIATGVDNAGCVATIASITVNGRINGTGASGDSFGIVAEDQAALVLKVGGVTQSITAAVGAPQALDVVSDDVFIITIV